MRLSFEMLEGRILCDGETTDVSYDTVDVMTYAERPVKIVYDTDELKPLSRQDEWAFYTDPIYGNNGCCCDPQGSDPLTEQIMGPQPIAPAGAFD